MPEIKNNFLKGKMNQDLDSRILPQGEYREAINLLISRSEGATVGEFENILGNTNVGTVSSAKNLSVIGHFIDETNATLYVFATDFSDTGLFSRAASTDTCQILEFDLNSPLIPTVLVDGFFLNFNKKFPIYGVNLLEELLFWTDNFNQPRRINITTARNNGSAYTEEMQISVAKYYPFNPLIPLERQTVTTTAGSSSTQIILNAGNANIRVGDIVTDNDKTDFSTLVIGNSLPPVRVTEIVNPGTNTIFNVSPAISSGAPATGVVLDFSRTTMENHSSVNNSNYSTQDVTTIFNSGSGLTTTTLTSYITAGPGSGGAPLDASNGTYNGTPGTTAGFTTDSTLGTGIDISVTISLGGVSAVTCSFTDANGRGWVDGDTITIATSVIGGSTDVVVTLTAAAIDTVTMIRIDPAVLGGVPRVLDIVTNTTSPNNTPFPGNSTSAAQFNLRIAQLAISQVDTTDAGRWDITFDKDATAGGAVAGFTVADEIDIASNPLYNAAYSGDSRFLEDKFVRFSYRFKFNDNEYSLMAPFSSIMFVPKQYGEFGLGQIDDKVNDINDYYQNESDAYNSTILEWFENDIDTIGLKIPLPDSITNLATIYNIQKIDVLYKESDAQAVKVLDSIIVSDIVSGDTETINYNDDQHGLDDQLYYDYAYESNKPYKTLPSGQTTRVYDKVPVKALAQEVISNRVVYGNFTQRMTPPTSINYRAAYQDRDMQTSDYATEYPYSTIKQNRTYQVGFVLVDKYGRQSDVVLSSNDGKAETKGSSVYIPYRSNEDATSSPVIDWEGTNLTLAIDEAIGAAINNTSGEPGIYTEHGHVASMLALTDGDDGYVANTTYATTSTGSGTGCTVRVTAISGSGIITTLAIMTGGSGYVQGEELTITGGDGLGAFTVNIGEANPLGWYSYKVVVKQQEQEYYNAFFPGFINGLPINDKVWDGVPRNADPTVLSTPGTEAIETQRGKIFFTSLLTENINKVPRSLDKIGPTDREYNSEETLFIRVNNPNVTSTEEVRNLQYYPGQIKQEVLNIGTARETELAPIPFVPFSIAPDPSAVTPVELGTNQEYVYAQSYPAGNKGKYDSTLRYLPVGYSTTTPVAVTTPTGSLPWGDVANKESFFQADENPFIMKIGQVANYGNPIGAIVCGAPLFTAVPHDSNYADGVRTMEPVLSIGETEAVYSRLALFWETTQSGKLEELNSAINTNDNAAVALDITTGSFLESVASATNVGNAFKFIDGSGAIMSNIVGTPTITKVYRQNDIAKNQINPGFFTIDTIIANTQFKIQTADTFWYGVNSNNDPSGDIYIFDLEVESTGTPNDIRNISAAITLTLTNVVPCIKHTSISGTAISTGCGGTGSYDLTGAGLSPAVEDTNIVQLYGTNGSSRTTDSDYTRDLVWQLTALISDSGAVLSDFSIDSTGLITSNAIMIADEDYAISVSLTDVNDTGSNKLVATANITWTAGAEYAPKIIGQGNTLAGDPGDMPYDKRGEWRFTNDTYSLASVTSTGYPAGWTAATWVYNSQVEYNADYGTSCRADLFQGAIYIKPKIFNSSTAPGDASIYYSIQYRINSGTSWVNIDTASGSTDSWSSGTSYAQFIRTTTGAGNEQKSYKFDQIGEYRVVTTQPTGSGVSVVEFTVDYQDGNQAGPSFTSGPCIP